MSSYLDSAAHLRMVMSKGRQAYDDTAHKYVLRSARRVHESCRKTWTNNVVKTREGVPAAESLSHYLVPGMSDKESTVYKKLLRDKKRRGGESAYGPPKKPRDWKSGKAAGGGGRGGGGKQYEKQADTFDPASVQQFLAAVAAVNPQATFDPFAGAGRGGGGGNRHYNNNCQNYNKYEGGGGGGYGNSQGRGNNSGPVNAPNNG